MKIKKTLWQKLWLKNPYIYGCKTIFLGVVYFSAKTFIGI